MSEKNDNLIALALELSSIFYEEIKCSIAESNWNRLSHILENEKNLMQCIVQLDNQIFTRKTFERK